MPKTRRSLILEYRWDDIEKLFFFKILEQSHRLFSFCPESRGDKNTFRHKDDQGTYTLSSAGQPAISNSNPADILLYVRGSHRDRDNEVLRARNTIFAAITRAVVAYNQQYTRNKLEIEDVAIKGDV